MKIRKVVVGDASGLVKLLEKLDCETNFMMFEPSERKITTEKQKERLRSMGESQNQEMFVAEVEGEIVGYIVGRGGSANRNRHALYIVTGVLKGYWGRGIGKQLMQALESWATENNFHRLELTVMSYNKRAVALYTKCGFEQEGIKRDSLLVNGKYVNEFYMSKLI